MSWSSQVASDRVTVLLVIVWLGRVILEIWRVRSGWVAEIGPADISELSITALRVPTSYVVPKPQRVLKNAECPKFEQ